MKHLLPCLFTLAAAGPALSQPAQDWAVSVQQVGPVVPAGGELRLQRAPFTLQFTGPARMGYGVLAAASCKELEALKTPAQVATLIRPTNLSVEGSTAAENTHLDVNMPGTVTAEASTAQAWAESAEDGLHSFQGVAGGPGGSWVATRRIDTLVLRLPGDATQAVAVAQYPQAQLCIVLTGLPPGSAMAHTQPKLLRLRFP